MVIEDLLNELIDYISTSGREEDAANAKERFFSDAGGLLDDENSYDTRVASFLEWYVFDRSMGGKTIFEEFIEGLPEGRKKELFQRLRGNVRSIFDVRKVEAKGIHLRDLRDGRKYFAECEEDAMIFEKGNIIDARLLPCDGGYHLSRSYVFHPPEARKFIIAALREAESRGEINGTINTLAVMSLKVEKYRSYKVEMVYGVKAKG